MPDVLLVLQQHTEQVLSRHKKVAELKSVPSKTLNQSLNLSILSVFLYLILHFGLSVSQTGAEKLLTWWRQTCNFRSFSGNIVYGECTSFIDQDCVLHNSRSLSSALDYIREYCVRRNKNLSHCRIHGVFTMPEISGYTAPWYSIVKNVRVAY